MQFKKFKAFCDQKNISLVEPTDDSNLFSGVNEKGETLFVFETGEGGIIKYVAEAQTVSGQPKVIPLETIPFLLNGQTNEITLIKLGYDVTVTHTRKFGNGEVRAIKAVKEHAPTVQFTASENGSFPTTRIEFTNGDKLIITTFHKALKVFQ